MKSFIVFALFVAAAVAVPVNPDDAQATILYQENDNIGVDGYKEGYETSNGIKAEESGQLTEVGTENEGISVRGFFSYVGPDGVTYTVNYVADRNGFQPDAPHIPRA